MKNTKKWTGRDITFEIATKIDFLNSDLKSEYVKMEVFKSVSKNTSKAF